MSYDVRLVDPQTGTCVQVPSHQEGGTYAVGGTPDASLNVTYNYGEVYALFDFNLRELNGERAGDHIVQLTWLVGKLGTREYRKDYWAPTPGNAGHALEVLLRWAERYPDARFEVT